MNDKIVGGVGDTKFIDAQTGDALESPDPVLDFDSEKEAELARDIMGALIAEAAEAEANDPLVQIATWLGFIALTAFVGLILLAANLVGLIVVILR